MLRGRLLGRSAPEPVVDGGPLGVRGRGLDEDARGVRVVELVQRPIEHAGIVGAALRGLKKEDEVFKPLGARARHDGSWCGRKRRKALCQRIRGHDLKLGLRRIVALERTRDARRAAAAVGNLTPERLLEHGARHRAVAQDLGPCPGKVDDGRLHADLADAAVENGVELSRGLHA